MAQVLEHTATTPKEKEAAKLEVLKQNHNFYKIKTNADGDFQGIIIKKAKIVDKLRDYNFFRFDIDAETSRYVYIEDNKVREVSKEQITDKFITFVENLEPLEHEIIIYKKVQGERSEIPTKILITSKLIRETIFEKLTEYFSKALLNRLTPPKPIEIKRDTKDEKFFYFRNNFIKVTEKGFEILDYKHLDLTIWENQKLNREFKADYTKGDFERFVERVCGYDGKEEPGKLVKKRITALRTIIGYNLHGFFDCKLYATILTDSRLSDEDEPNGRTGKTLFAKALGQMLNYDKLSRVYCEINGKDYNPRDKHRYSDASIETQLININDLSRNTSIEIFFNDITEGITVDKKNEKPFRVLSKIIISTNKTIKIDGESAKDRVIQFEFSDYFNANRSPVSELGGKWMFSGDWEKKDWNQFDTFMIGCVVEYLKSGIIEADSINLHRRTLIDHTSHEFVDFMDDFLRNGKIELKTEGELYDKSIVLKYGEKIEKKELYNAFTGQYPNDYRNLKQSTFTKWLRYYAKHTDDLEPISKENETEGRSNSIDWIILKKTEENETA